MAPALMCEVPRATLSVGVNLKGEIELRSFMCFRSFDRMVVILRGKQHVNGQATHSGSREGIGDRAVHYMSRSLWPGLQGRFHNVQANCYRGLTGTKIASVIDKASCLYCRESVYWM